MTPKQGGDCPTCNGYGDIDVYEVLDYTGRVECPDCEGTGKR